MSTSTNHSCEAALLYITFTCCQWLHLFELCEAYDLVYNWFNVLKASIALKPLPIHYAQSFTLHIIFSKRALQPKYDRQQREAVCARLNDHSGRAYEIIKRLEAKGLSKILIQLKEGLTERDVTKGQKPARIPLRRA